MSEFGGMEDLLQDFLTESSELLSEVDNKLVELEKRPDDRNLLNDIFRGFHTIKGGAGFLNVDAMVSLCHRTENLFDKLRNGELTLSMETMDVIMAATGEVREMFGALSQMRQPPAAPNDLLAALDRVLQGESAALAAPAPAPIATPAPVPAPAPEAAAPVPTAAAPAAQAGNAGEPDWQNLYNTLLDKPPAPAPAPAVQAEAVAAPIPAPAPIAPAVIEGEVRSVMVEPMQSLKPAPAPKNQPQGGMQQVAAPETTIRIDTVRLDQVLNLSGEIGLTKNRLTTLRSDIMAGKMDTGTLKALDEAISQLDLLVGDLQNAVMKTRMQPIGRLFQKYPRLARDLARQLGKDVELVLTGEETELDKTMLEDLNDPLVHLVRNAVDHGVETIEERIAVGKPAKAVVELSATQVGDHILIEITDDGRGMRPDVIRKKAIEKGLIDVETANSLDEKQSLQLIFLPGFSTKDQISNISGRGVGMDVVKTNIS